MEAATNTSERHPDLPRAWNMEGLSGGPETMEPEAWNVDYGPLAYSTKQRPEHHYEHKGGGTIGFLGVLLMPMLEKIAERKLEEERAKQKPEGWKTRLIRMMGLGRNKPATAVA